jgi:glycosyltransferase involved in cell wall biosynthesis
MTQYHPLVSIGLPVYNGANFVGEMIESILAQTFTDFELIVTDNASTDNTGDIVKAFAKKDPRVRYYLNEKNVGAAGNYNRCYEHGVGKYFKWCAHDDRISANYLEACVTRLEANPDLAMVYGSKIEFNDKGEIPLAEGADNYPDLSDDPGARYFFQVAKLKAPCSAIFGVFRRSLLEKSTLHRPYYSSDRALLAEIAISGNFEVAEEAVYYCRMHESRSVNIADRVERSQWISGTSNRFTSAEHINLTRHLYEIAGRHKDVVSPWKLRWQLFKFMANPRQIGRYAFDLFGFVLPKATFWIKSKINSKKQHSNV